MFGLVGEANVACGDAVGGGGANALNRGSGGGNGDRDGSSTLGRVGKATNGFFFRLHLPRHGIEDVLNPTDGGLAFRASTPSIVSLHYYAALPAWTKRHVA